MLGDKQLYKEESKKNATTGGIIVLRSLVWPGAYVLYQNERWYNIYVGNGHKADGKDYYPVYPPMVWTEPVDVTEMSEPNPKETGAAKGGDPKTVIGLLQRVLAEEETFATALNKSFALIDTNNSGKIDKKEIKVFLASITKEFGADATPNPKAVEEFMKLYDQDQSGTISKEELAQPLKELLAAWESMLVEELEGAEPAGEEGLEPPGSPSQPESPPPGSPGN